MQTSSKVVQALAEFIQTDLIKVYLTLSVKVNLVKFHSISTYAPRSAQTCLAIQLLVDTCLKDMHRQNVG